MEKERKFKEYEEEKAFYILPIFQNLNYLYLFKKVYTFNLNIK